LKLALGIGRDGLGLRGKTGVQLGPRSKEGDISKIKKTLGKNKRGADVIWEDRVIVGRERKSRFGALTLTRQKGKE